MERPNWLIKNKKIRQIFDNPILGCLTLGIALVATAYAEWWVTQKWVAVAMCISGIWFAMSFMCHGVHAEMPVIIEGDIENGNK